MHLSSRMARSSLPRVGKPRARIPLRNRMKSTSDEGCVSAPSRADTACLDIRQSRRSRRVSFPALQVLGCTSLWTPWRPHDRLGEEQIGFASLLPRPGRISICPWSFTIAPEGSGVAISSSASIYLSVYSPILIYSYLLFYIRSLRVGVCVSTLLYNCGFTTSASVLLVPRSSSSWHAISDASFEFRLFSL